MYACQLHHQLLETTPVAVSSLASTDEQHFCSHLLLLGVLLRRHPPSANSKAVVEEGNILHHDVQNM